jgi:hypothetical protein
MGLRSASHHFKESKDSGNVSSADTCFQMWTTNERKIVRLFPAISAQPHGVLRPRLTELLMQIEQISSNQKDRSGTLCNTKSIIRNIQSSHN